MEELKPGQHTTIGPDPEGKFLVLHSLEYDGPREQSFEEVESNVDEIVFQREANRMLEAFLARHRATRRIVQRPELVMRIDLTDPAADDL
jgi:hypothetical protein